MNLSEIRKSSPNFEGLSDKSIIDVLHEVYYPDISKDVIAQRVGYKPPPAPKESAGVLRTIADMGIKGAQGVVDLGQSVVGVGSLATGGLLGKGLRSVGYDPEATNAMLGEGLSDAQKESEQNMQNAGGFVDTLLAAPHNLRAVAGSVVESLPQMFAAGGLSGAVARRIAMAAAAPLGGLGTEAGAAAGQVAVEAAAKKLIAVGSIGEGAQSAGQIADQAQGAGREYGQYALPALAAGAGTAAIGTAAGRLMGSAETALFTGAKSAGVQGKLPMRIAKGITEEGLLEEMPQSAQEQVFTNIAMGKDPGEGVGNAAAMGLVTGGVMGGAMGAISPHNAANHVRATETVPETGVLSAAANVGTEAKAAMIEAGPPIVPPTPEPPPVDPVFEQIKGIKDDAARNEALHAYAIINRPDVPKGVRQYNSKLLDKHLNALEVEQAAAKAAETPLLGYDTTPTGAMVAGPDGVRQETKADLINRDQVLAEQQAENERRVGLGLPPLAMVEPTAAGEAAAPAQALAQAPAELPAAPAAEGKPAPASDVPVGTFKTADEAKAFISQQRRAGGARIEALPLPLEDGSFGLATKGTPEFAKAEAYRAEQDQKAAGILPGDVMTKTGKPFASKLPATNAAKKAGPGHEVVPVTGGFVVRKEWHQFDAKTGTLGVPRADMPQIQSAHHGALINFLNARGVTHETQEVDPGTLKPTQAEYSIGKAEKMGEVAEGDRSILVSSDNHVLDGHHQWLAAGGAGKPVKIIRLNAPIKELLPLAREFPSAQSVEEQAAPDKTAAPPEKQFKVLKGYGGDVTMESVPWSMLSEKTAQANNQQSLDELNRRGGLDPREILAHVKGLTVRQLGNMPMAQAETELKALIAKHVSPGPAATPDAKVSKAEAPKPGRETITPANDKSMGANADGEPLFERADGSRYRMHNGKPDFGGDLAPVEAKAEASAPAAPALEPAPTAGGAAEPHLQTEAEFGQVEKVKAIASAEKDFADAKAGKLPSGMATEYKSKAAAVRATEAHLEKTRAAPPEHFASDHLAAINRAREKGQDTTPENLKRYDLKPLTADPAAAEWDGATAKNRLFYAEKGGLDLTSRQRAELGDKQWSALSEAERAAVTKGMASDGTVAPKPPVNKAAKIDDFGEKLEGARKDYAAVLKDAGAVEIAAALLSESWPEPNYDKLIEGGATPYAVAFAHAARDMIPTKPKQSWKLKRWVDQVELLRDLTAKILSKEIDDAKLRAQLNSAESFNGPLARALTGPMELYQRLGHDTSLKGVAVSAGQYSMHNGKAYSPAKTIWTVERHRRATAFSNWPSVLAEGDTREQAIEAFIAKAKEAPAQEPTKREVSFDIWRQNGKYNVGKKIGREYVSLHKTDDVAAARAYRTEHRAELEAALERYRSTPFERKAENLPRVGADHRSGGRVTPEAFASAFGFRGVQFGNYVENTKRQQDLNDAYDGLMDLAAVMGVPARALSLDGKLGLAFGARGNGGRNPAAAHYEPGKVVINLTKESGAGSLAHEWFHAVDNYFAKMGDKGSGYMSAGAQNENVRPEMAAAFAAVTKAVRGSEMRTRSKVLDKRRAKPYWSTDLELAARAFESYIIAKLQDQDASNDYLANVVSEKAWDGSEAVAGHEEEKTYPYPTEAEMGPIREAFDKFFDAVQTKDGEDSKVVLFSRSDGLSIDPATLPGTIAEKVERAREFALEHFAGTTVTNESDGQEIMIPATGIKHAMSGEVSPLAALAMTRMDDVIAHAQFVSAEPDKKGRNTIREVRFYEVPINAGDERGVIRVVVRVAADGSRYYDHFEVKKKAPAGLSGKQEDPGSLQPFTGAVPTEADTAIIGNSPASATAGLAADDAQRVADAFTTQGLPVKVADTMEDLPASGKKRIKSEGTKGVRGMYDKATGITWLVRENLSSVDEALFVGLHEAFHRGLARNVPGAKDVLNAIFIGNQRVRKATAEYMAKHKVGRAEAIEEVLADLAGAGTVSDLKGWDKLMAVLRDFVTQLAKGLGIKIEVTDAMVMGFVTGVRDLGMQQLPLDLRAPVDIDQLLQEQGIPITSSLDALRWFNDGARIFGMHDQAESAHEIRTMKELESYAPDQMMVLPDTAGKGDGIRFSRTADPRDATTFAGRARDAFNDFASTRKTFGWWNNTIGTQYQKAQQDKDFARVFNTVQDYILDVSRLANDAADRARDLLPKLENLKDVIKHTKKADVQAIGKALFQGTLADKREYKAEELKRVFKLTDTQVDLYQQFRAAVNKSLDDLTATTAAKLLRNSGIPTDMLRDELEAGDHAALAGLAQQAADADAKLQGMADQVKEISERAQTLKGEGYAPLMRFGQYAVSVRDPLTKALKEFYLFESERAANVRARELAAKGDLIEKSVMSQEDYKLLKGVSPESLELFGDILEKAGMFDTRDELYQTYLRQAIDQRSAMKRMIQRVGYPGYSEDVRRVLATFVTSNARLAAKNLHYSEMLGAADSIPKSKGDVRDQATQLVNYVQEPVEEASKIRGLLFAQYIGGSVASALVNTTQTLTMTYPYLSQFTNPVKAAATVMSAMKQAMGKIEGPLAEALIRAEQSGVVSPQEIHNLNAEAIGKFGSNPIVQKGMFLWGSLFSLAEQYNRRVAFIAGYNTAIEQKKADPYAFAVKAVEETQGVYNKGNRPNWARGPIGATVFTFKQFSISYLEFLKRLPNRERALALAILMLAAGADGLPFADDLDDIIDTIAQQMGYSFNSKQQRHRFLAANLGEGGADFVSRGFSSIPGMPIDVSQRMGMANLIPGTGVLRKDVKDHMSEILEVLGPAGSSVKDLVNNKWVPSSTSDLATNPFAPVSIRNLAKSADMFQTGMYRDSKGRKVVDVDGTDALWKAVGFQPAQVAEESQRSRLANQNIQFMKASEGEIADEIAQARFEHDGDKETAARARLRDWNEKNPEARIVISPMQIASRLKAMRQSREQRIVKSAPKEQRGNVRAELAH